MWVEPGKMLSEVFGNALSYTFQGQRLTVTQGLRPERFSLEFGGVSQYLKVVFLKTTPVVWLGLILAVLGLWVKKGRPMAAICKHMVVYFGLLGLIFVLMFGIAQGRNHNHYILTTFIALDVIAGIGIAWGVGWLAERFHFAQKRYTLAALLVLILAVHAAGALRQYPYYYTYTNPLASALLGGFQDPDAGYGEGLELAGAYLAAKPGAKDLKAMSWYAAGPFSYYFPGTTYNLLISEHVESDYVERMKASDYLVIYSIQQKAVNMPEKLLKALQPIPPEKVIQLNGQEYIQIYAVDDFSDSFFDSIHD
jgi:hypothetical protein